MITYPMNVLQMHIVIRPKKRINAPTPFVIANVAMFFKARVNAEIAAVQKLSLVNAI